MVRDYIKPKSRLRRILSAILNFLCALFIMLIVYIAIGAFMQADANTKNITGDYESPIFSYIKVADSRAEVKAFGERFIIDLDKVSSFQNRLDEIADINRDYTPAFIILSGGIITECVSSVSESLKKIPGILIYFYNRTNNKNTNDINNGESN